MGDPEFYIDEHILIRSQGIFINSIPVEGILTNKRIILINKTANLLPRREIPLITLRDIEAAEDAIGNHIIKLTIQTGANETREMILAFSHQTPGTQIKERDAWLRILRWLRVLKENASSILPEQEIHSIIPEHEQVSPWIEEMRPPMPKYVPVAIKTTVKKEVTWTPSTEWIIKSRQISPPDTITKIYDITPPDSETYNPPDKVFNNLIFGVIFLILIIICSMLLSISSIQDAHDFPQGSNTNTQISSSNPLMVSLNPDSLNVGSMINKTQMNVQPGNSAETLPDVNLVITDTNGSPVPEIISPYVTIVPKAFPDMEWHDFPQPSITQEYSEDYVTIYSLTNQNISQVLPLVSFTLYNPPLVIDYNVTPQNQVVIKHIEYKLVETYYEENVEINRPYENFWFRIIVRNKDTGEVIAEDGIGRSYSFQTPKQLVIRESGNYSFEFTGDFGILDLTMKVKQEGNFP